MQTRSNVDADGIRTKCNMSTLLRLMQSWLQWQRNSPKVKQSDFFNCPGRVFRYLISKNVQFLLILHFLSLDLKMKYNILSEFDIQDACVTLKMRSRSPKCNHLFPKFKWCFCASLVKIHQLVQVTECRQGSFYSHYSVATLKIRTRSSKSNQIF